MPRKSKPSKLTDDHSLHAVANMRFWSRFKNPPPMLAFAFAEPEDFVDDGTDVFDRLPRVNSDDSQVYSIRISLDGCKPPTWRRVEVRSLSLDTLHHVIQLAMGWQDCHLHGFEICNVRVPLVEDGAPVDERGISIAQLQAAGITKFHYIYDFGDDWKHTILIERSFVDPTETFVPICVAGQGCCPLEDVGGVHLWSKLRAALRHPEQPIDSEVESLLDRLGADYAPKPFDMQQANSTLQMAFKKQILIDKQA